MSQLTFEGFKPTGAIAGGPLPAAAPIPKSSWYKGRVLSHSSVTTYLACPQKWKFRYVDKIPEKPRSFFSFGKSVHAGLEFLFTNLQALPTLEDVIAHYKQGWLREGYDSDVQEKWFFQEGERILKGFYAKHQKELQRVLQVEYKFTIDVEGVPVMGFIDRIDQTPAGGLAIIDYKTGKAIEKSRVRQDPQLTLYQIACRTLIGKPVESVTLYHLNSLTPLTVPAHSESMEDQVRANIVEVAKGITENKFEPKPSESNCQWCDYRQICPATGKSGPTAVDESAPLSPLVDRYAKLDLRILELTKEKQELEANIRAEMRQRGVRRLKGQMFFAFLEETKPVDAAVLSWGDNLPETAAWNPPGKPGVP